MRDPAQEKHHPFYRLPESHTRRAADLRCCVCRCLPGAGAWLHTAVEGDYCGTARTCSSAYCRDRGRWVARARAWLAKPLVLGPPEFRHELSEPVWQTFRYTTPVALGKCAMYADLI